MEAVMKLQKECWKFKISFGQLMAGILLAVFVAAMYRSGLKWRVSDEASIGRACLTKTSLQTVDTYPDLAGVESMHRILKDPEEIKLTDTVLELPLSKRSVSDEERSSLPALEVPVSQEGEEPIAESPAAGVKENTVSPETIEPVLVHVKVYGNGGHPQLSELTLEDCNLDAAELDIPRRLGKVFNGWYTDAACTTSFTSIAEGETAVELYAGWKEFSNFLCDDRGYITGYSDGDAVAFDESVILPTSEDCLGVAAGAFAGLEDRICEIYLPANITYVAPGALDGLYNLFYIKAAEGNPAYYDKEGILYNRDGTLAVWPAGRSTEE